MFKRSDDDWNPRVVFDGYLWGLAVSPVDISPRFRVVRNAVSGGSYRIWELAVERMGYQDAMGQVAWLPVTGDDKFKVLAMVGVLLHTLEREDPPPPADELINPDEPKV